MLPSPSSVSASSSIVHRVVHYASFLSSTDPVHFYRIATFRLDQNFEVLSFGPFKMAPPGPFYIMARKYPRQRDLLEPYIARVSNVDGSKVKEKQGQYEPFKGVKGNQTQGRSSLDAVCGGISPNSVP